MEPSIGESIGGRQFQRGLQREQDDNFGLGYGYPLAKLASRGIEEEGTRSPHNIIYFTLGYSGIVGVAIFCWFRSPSLGCYGGFTKPLTRHSGSFILFTDLLDHFSGINRNASSCYTVISFVRYGDGSDFPAHRGGLCQRACSCRRAGLNFDVVNSLNAFASILAPGPAIRSLYASTVVGPAGRVFAFEPAPRNIANIKKHVAMNHLARPCGLAAFRVQSYEPKPDGPNQMPGLGGGPSPRGQRRFLDGGKPGVT